MHDRNKKLKQSSEEQIERDQQIRLQQEHDELARIELVRKQKFYNGALMNTYHQQQHIEFELVLETNPMTNEIVIEVPLLLVMHLVTLTQVQ